MPVFLILAIVAAPRPAQAQTSAWSKPVLISGGTNTLPWNWFSAVAADGYGNVHVVWEASTQTGGGDTPPIIGPKHASDDVSWLLYTEWNGKGWSSPIDIAGAAPESVAVRSALAADSKGILHLIYRGMDLADPNSGSRESLRYSAASVADSTRATAWSPGIEISRNLPTYFPDLRIDNRGVLHTIWTEYDGSTGYGLYYSRSADGGKTWSDRIALDGTDAVYYYRPQLRIGPKGDLHAVWEVLNPSDALAWAAPPIGFLYAQSTDGGMTWTTTSFIKGSAAPRPIGRPTPTPSSTDSIPVEPAVGIDGSGHILLVWRDSATNVVYFQESTDGRVWTAPVDLPGVAEGVARPFDHYDMATDSAGHVHLVLVGYPTGSTVMSLLHLEWNGETWSQPDTVVGSPQYPEWPDIVVGLGNRLHVVWFVGDSPFISRTPTGIWYSTAISSAPAIALETAAPASLGPPKETPTPVVLDPSTLFPKSLSAPTGENVPVDNSHEPGVTGESGAGPLEASAAVALGLLALAVALRRFRLLS